MSKIFTNRFKINAITALIESQPAYFIFVGRHTPYDNESIPPALVDNIQTTYVDVYDQMLFAKSVELNDVSFMVPRVDWTYGTVYNRYDHESTTLYDTAFYVNVDSGSGYDVFKCLSNAGGIPSTSAPELAQTSASDDVYETSDGYQWKYMYSISNAEFDKFATADYVPIIDNANVVANAVHGSIDYIDVSYEGSNYDSYTNGAFQSVTVAGNTQVFYIQTSASANSNFYNGCSIKVTSGTGTGQQRTIQSYSVSGSTRQVVIDTAFTVNPTTSSTYEITPNAIVVGDGSGFIGRALVNSTSNSIYKVEITNRGNNYTFGTMTFTGNTGGVSNTAVGRVIISPPGGHGSDAAEELGAHYMGLSVKFDASESSANGKLFDVNDFRVVGVISNPQLANMELTYTGSIGTFEVGEQLTQTDTYASGYITFANTTTLRLTNVSPSINWFLPGNSIYGTITGGNTATTAQVVSVRNNGSADLSANLAYINQTTTLNVSSVTGTFVPDEIVTGTGNTATSNAVLYRANSSVIHITNVKGTFGGTLTGANSGATATITTTRPGDFVVGSGDVVYIENITAINKNAGQTEKIKAVIEF
jgi:hypothetical protein